MPPTLALLLLAHLAHFALSKPGLLAATPPMGWSSWNQFGGHQSAELLLSTCEALNRTGLLHLGYKQVDMDGGWNSFKSLNASGYPRSERIPELDGGVLAAQLHARGCKLGMYVTGGFQSVFQHEEAWAEKMFNEWGADSVKIDHMCNTPACRSPSPSPQISPSLQRATMERWDRAIAKTGRAAEILVQNCGVGCSPAFGAQSHTPRAWGGFCPQTAHSWRTSGDINWEYGAIIGQNLRSLIGRGSLAGPGLGWNYPDALEVGVTKHGNKTLPPLEARAHFSLWCITSSPLYLSMDLQNRTTADDDDDALRIVSNRDAIMVNQAWAGYAGDMLNFTKFAPLRTVCNSTYCNMNVSRLPTGSVWWKPLSRNGTDRAAAVLYNNDGGGALEIGFDFDELVWDGQSAIASGQACQVRTVWAFNGKPAGAELGLFSDGQFTARVESRACVFVILHGCRAQ